MTKQNSGIAITDLLAKKKKKKKKKQQKNSHLQRSSWDLKLVLFARNHDLNIVVALDYNYMYVFGPRTTGIKASAPSQYTYRFSHKYYDETR